MATEIKRIQLRRDTIADWTTTNPILAEGEYGYETDTGHTRIGDGSSTFTQLPRRNGNFSPFETVAILLADTTLTTSNTSVGDIIEAQGFRYEVVASGGNIQNSAVPPVLFKVLEGDDGEFNLLAFGVDKTGATDVTVKVQAAMDYVFNLTGGHINQPDGTYLISSALIIRQWAGFKFIGASRLGVVWKQSANNTPIFRFTKENTHSFTFRSMSFTWTNTQAISNTSAVAFFFDGDTATGAGFYNGIINDVHWDRGCRGVSTSDTRANLVWGMTFDHITHGSLMSGASIRLLALTGGSPNNYFGEIYMRGDSAQETLIQLKALTSFTADNIEVNNDTNGQTIMECTAGCVGNIRAIRSESGVYSTTGQTVLLKGSDSHVIVDTATLSTTTFNASSGKFYLIGLSGGTGSFKVGHLQIGTITITAGSVFALNGSAARRLTLDTIDGLSVLTGLTDVDASSVAAGVVVTDWDYRKPSADIGDADLTVEMGDANVIFYSTELTANRTISLPKRFNPTNVFEGARFTVVRDAATPGTFTLIITTTGGGAIATMPVDVRATITLVYRRNAWLVEMYSVLL